MRATQLASSRPFTKKTASVASRADLIETLFFTLSKAYQNDNYSASVLLKQRIFQWVCFISVELLYGRTLVVARHGQAQGHAPTIHLKCTHFQYRYI